MPEVGQMRMPVSFRWLGVAGIEVCTCDQVLTIDPFFTRPRFLRMWFGRVEPDHALISEQLPHCDAILITHFNGAEVQTAECLLFVGGQRGPERRQVVEQRHRLPVGRFLLPHQNW